MIQLLLIVTAVAAAASAALGFSELSTVYSSASRTVFQQISARVDIGLSLLVLTASAGLYGVIDRQAKTVRELQRLRTLIERAPGTTPAIAAEEVSHAGPIASEASVGTSASGGLPTNIVQMLMVVGGILLGVVALYLFSRR